MGLSQKSAREVESNFEARERQRLLSEEIQRSARRCDEALGARGVDVVGQWVQSASEGNMTPTLFTQNQTSPINKLRLINMGSAIGKIAVTLPTRTETVALGSNQHSSLLVLHAGETPDYYIL